jgi:hypothetical protein
MGRYTLESIALILREYMNYTKDSYGQKVRLHNSYSYDAHVNEFTNTVSILILLPHGTAIIADVDHELNTTWSQEFLFRLHPEDRTTYGVEFLDSTNRYHQFLIAKQYTSYLLQKIFSLIP